jgi:hypothetical protein
MKTAQLIALLLTIADAAHRGVRAAQEGKAKLQQIVAEDRDPTEAELAELRAITTKLHEEIQSA